MALSLSPSTDTAQGAGVLAPGCSVKSSKLELFQKLSNSAKSVAKTMRGCEALSHICRQHLLEVSYEYGILYQSGECSSENFHWCTIKIADVIVCEDVGADKTVCQVRAAEKAMKTLMKPQLKLELTNKGQLFLMKTTKNEKPNAVTSENLSKQSAVLSEAATRNIPSDPQSKLHAFLHKKKKNHDWKAHKITLFQNVVNFVRAYLSEKKFSDLKVIHKACGQSKASSTFDFKIVPSINGRPSGNIYVCSLIIVDVLISQDFSFDKNESKARAAKVAVELFTKPQFFLRIDKSGMACLSPENPDGSSMPVLQKNQNLDRLSSDLEMQPFQTSQNAQHSSSAQTSLSTCTAEPAHVGSGPTFMIYDMTLSRKRTKNENYFVLQDSSKFCHVPVKFSYVSKDCGAGKQRLCRCFVSLGREVICDGTGQKKGKATKAASKAAVQILKKRYYTVKLKKNFENFVITPSSLSQLQLPPDVASSTVDSSKRIRLSPVSAENNDSHVPEAVRRTEQEEFTLKVDVLLSDYARSDITSDFVFASGFTGEQMKIIRRKAFECDLEVVNGAKENMPCVTLKRKFTPQRLFKLLTEAGGSTSKYELIPPSKGV